MPDFILASMKDEEEGKDQVVEPQTAMRKSYDMVSPTPFKESNLG